MTALEYLQDLISFESTSNLSNVDIADHVQSALTELGFDTERIEYDDKNGVRKASVVGKQGAGAGGMAYAGHTDVVPADDWFQPEHGPYRAVVDGDRVYGRGSCDMKGSIACMLAAVERLKNVSLDAPLYILATADEEIGYGGAKSIVSESKYFREMVAHDTRTVVGEPTMLEVVNVHKGSGRITATSRGRAAHSSTSEGLNANLAMIPFLQVMKEIHDETETDPAWQNTDFDPPTLAWNIGINDHTAATNITPPQSVCTVVLRSMPGIDVSPLLERVVAAGEAFGVDVKIDSSTEPLTTSPDAPVVRDLLEVTGNAAAKTVTYGTDASVLTGLHNLVVFGPGDIAQAHTVNEWIVLEQLDKGTDVYETLIRRWCIAP
ncbi:MAG TPA: acetylornithine deacetylase [Lentisphaeria bacterium]|nr:acetylornithine deacetylase [Lentisphaeria bacterium]